ncbi:capsular polysaccharide export protein, LipB/KpsS family [Oceanobacillus salinisoli]|uniref:capsular polysaccharide export protein, LipB/KpsS family n=1 Tax=Oceanobacillus salinisoli TaxID=2678611 RepID=UPI0012E1E110|nr:hypothetical protein [Oceanobacillus salinisoli]
MTKKLKKKMRKIAKRILSQLNLYQPKNKSSQKIPFEEIGSSWKDADKPVAFMFGFNPWKREHISNVFPEYRTAFVFGSADLDRLRPYFPKNRNMVFIVWGYKEPDEIREYAKKKGIKLIRTEDGFVRSVGLGAGHSLPMSIVTDEKGLYFDSRGPSDLEAMLQTYKFQENPDLLEKAKASMEKLIQANVSKYNHVAPTDIEKIYGAKMKKRILVIGQVEEDASIQYGCDREITNNDLVWAAFNENPNAEIIYKPHPDVLTGHRKKVSNPKDVEHIAKVITVPLSLTDTLQTIDHVYTITSLSGFEALMRGIPVTCFGMPFYAGWGLTDDRQVNHRRNRKLTVEELFAGAYLMYPRYISLQTKELIGCEQAIDELVKQIQRDRLQKDLEYKQKILKMKNKKKKPFEEVGVNWEEDTDSKKPIAYMFGFNPWKREHISRMFPEYRTAFTFGKTSLKKLFPYIIDETNIVFIVWGYKESDEIREYAKEKGIKLIRTEDGFVRSLGLGAGHSLPMSIVADEKGLYFDSRGPSDLEEILQTYDFRKRPDLLEQAKTNMDKLIQTGVSKYNHVGPAKVKKIYGEKTKKRVLVIGQVEEDASIQYGCDREITNNDLVWAAYRENPDAEIIYKPHPDVLTGHRDKLSNPNDVTHIAKVIKEPLGLVDALETIDHVYTITSLAGFEALMRGIKVTCFGMPFYAGWGLTDDRQVNTRRTRKLTLEELFAGSYLLYPRYISLQMNELIDCEQAIDELAEEVKLDRLQKEEEYKRKIVKKKNKKKKPFVEVGENWEESASDKPIAYMIGFNPWKREHISRFFPEYRTAFTFGKTDLEKLLPYIIDDSNFVFIVWGFKESDEIREYAEEHGIKLIRTEDGFVRSLGLGAGHSLPMSIVADEQTLYFDSRGSSHLEHILQTYDFKSRPELLETARRNLDKLVHTGISKYNHVGPTNIEKIYGKKTKKRILVIGQVEEDASIQYGCNREITNNDLVGAAYKENPDAEIIYKPHPDVLTGHRNMVSDPMAVAHISKVVTEPLSLVDSLKTIDHVYTITSLSGFEALIRGISVTCFGSPFYAGWGLTDDRQPNDRRTRTLTMEELFAGAYLLYPRYISLETNQLIDCDRTIDELLSTKIDHLMGKVQENRTEAGIADLEQLIQKAIQLDVNVQEHYLKLAQLAELKHAYQESINYYETVLDMCKDQTLKADVCYKITDLKINIGDFYRVKDYLYTAMNATDHHNSLVLLVKYIWENEGLTEECLQLAERLEMKLDSLSAEEVILLAAIRNDAGLYHQALQLVEKAVAMDSKVMKNCRYLALVAMLDYRMPEFIPNSDIENEYYNRLTYFEGTFEQMVRDADGDICIVGNHPSAEDACKGEWVNSRELVIRINDYSIDFPLSQDYGTKTDIWIKEPAYDQSYRRNVNDFDLVVISGPNIEHTNENGVDLFIDFLDAEKPVQTIPHPVYTELAGKLDAKPSTELLVLYWIYKIQGPIQRDNIIGFSNDEAKEMSVLENIIFQDYLEPVTT